MPIPAEVGTDIFYGEEGPTPKQVLFRDAPQKYKLFGGGVGGGKSVALCAECLRLSLIYPGNRGFLGRHEAEALRKTTLVTFMSLIYKIESLGHQKLMTNHSQTKKEITLINGSVIMYGGLGGPEDMDRIKSLEIGHYEIDEASETNFEVIKMLKARLRWKLPDGTYPKFFGLYASNPEPGWVKDTFVTPQLRGEQREEHIFIQALVKDNPYLPPTYIEDLKRDNPADWVERYINGSWDAVEGQVWKGYSFDTHVFPNNLSDFEIPQIGEVEHPFLIAGLDHGQSNPTCFLAAYVDSDDNIIIMDEYYSKGLVSEHVRAITSLFPIEKFDEIAADSTMWGKTREKDGNPWSVADEYQDRDVSITKANNDVMAGINRVAEYLIIDEKREHPFLDQKGSPRLFISKRCKNLITEIPEYIWKKQSDDALNKREEPRKYNDHACDALRYLIMTRPSVDRDKKDELIPGTFDWYLKGGDVDEKEGYLINV